MNYLFYFYFIIFCLNLCRLSNQDLNGCPIVWYCVLPMCYILSEGVRVHCVHRFTFSSLRLSRGGLGITLPYRRSSCHILNGGVS